jgi:hypothetical protein
VIFGSIGYWLSGVDARNQALIEAKHRALLEQRARADAMRGNQS